jgi:hypothetical protein
MRILVFDPGGTTGWTLFDIELPVVVNSKLSTFLRDHVRQGQIGNNTEHHLRLWSLIAEVQPDVIVCERFDNRGNEFSRIVSREYIGIVKMYGQTHVEVMIVWQGSDQAIGWTTDEKLRTLLLLCIPLMKWRHANDALRHLIYYLVFYSGPELREVRNFILDRLRVLAMQE